ncbi:hypothetical protein ON010_g9836 [Phytophthora cinnamomi]|nr:hypothetical protein ON010_g9836 [Phytophthora cinnamomi]
MLRNIRLKIEAPPPAFKKRNLTRGRPDDIMVRNRLRVPANRAARALYCCRGGELTQSLARACFVALSSPSCPTTERRSSPWRAKIASASHGTARCSAGDLAPRNYTVLHAGADRGHGLPEGVPRDGQDVPGPGGPRHRRAVRLAAAQVQAQHVQDERGARDQAQDAERAAVVHDVREAVRPLVRGARDRWSDRGQQALPVQHGLPGLRDDDEGLRGGRNHGGGALRYVRVHVQARHGGGGPVRDALAVSAVGLQP